MTGRLLTLPATSIAAGVLWLLLFPGFVSAADVRFAVEEKADRLVLSHAGKSIAEYVFRDPKILRPYFANVRAPVGLQVTRSFPPVEGVDAIDHDTMHPGIWLGFGDISGQDFWRNRGKIEHVRFIEPPRAANDAIHIATESRLLSANGDEICRLTSRIQWSSHTAGWLLVWEATFQSNEREFSFGDQEEMGFGARVATPLTEKNGGLITNSHGQKTAGKTWGQPADWCDYSGTSNGQHGGITLMAAPSNFRQSWWHNRDYGVIVANPFGRAAMKQGDMSKVTVERGKPFHIQFGALLHDSNNARPAKAYQDFLTLLKEPASNPK